MRPAAGLRMRMRQRLRLLPAGGYPMLRPLGPRMARGLRAHLPLIVVTLALLGVRAVSGAVVSQPGYTDAYYYAAVAGRVARGDGLTADFVWNFVEAPRLPALPIASHRFWMPLASLIQAAGIRSIGGLLGDFRAAQAATIVVAAFIPVVTYALARSFGARRPMALAAGALAGLGGAFAPAWVSLDSFAPAAVLGGIFFIAFSRASFGDVRAGALAGLTVGLMHLARAEAALFGLALLWLVGYARSARAGLMGSAIALAIGLFWLARNAALGFPADLFARTTLLVRYEDFFALASPTLAAFLSDLPQVALAKLSGLVSNAVTAAIAFLLLPLVALARGAWMLRSRPDVRAFLGLAAVIYLVESLAFTLHSVRGSYFHSLAPLVPFGFALAAAGAQGWLRMRGPRIERAAVAGMLAGAAVVSASALVEWDRAFNAPYDARTAIAASLPPGPLVATDASAWRWITGREVVVAPADGPRSAVCVAIVYLANTLILEPAHFSAYRQLYEGGTSEHFALRDDHGAIKVFRVREDQRCVIGRDVRPAGADGTVTASGPPSETR